MYTDTEGIVLRQTKTLDGRRMITLLSPKYGKIGAGTSITEKGKGKTALALRPFTYGRYELFKSRDSFSINGAETKKSFYRIGEDVEKYMAAVYALELTEKVTQENQNSQGIFNLLLDFLQTIEKRKAKFETPLLSYQTNILKLTGTFPRLSECVICGNPVDESAENVGFSVPEGGVVCESCMKGANCTGNSDKDGLIYRIDSIIIRVLKYFSTHSIAALEKLALEEKIEKRLGSMIRDYLSYHLDVGDLKSEGFFREVKYGDYIRKD